MHVKRIDRKLHSKGIKKQLLNPLTDRVFREVVSEVEQAHVELFAVAKRVMSSFSRDKRIRTGGIGVIEKALACSADKGDAVDFFIRRFEKRRTQRRAAEGFFQDGGRIRGVPVTIGGTSYVPPMPIESVVKENIEAILKTDMPFDEKAIRLCLYCMKTQIFNDGNKRASVIFANHYLISQGGGMIIIPEKCVPEFKRLLVTYYEDKDNGEILNFMKKQCIKTF